MLIGSTLCADIPVEASNLMTIRPLKKNGDNWVPEIEDFEYLLMENTAVIDRSLLIKKLLKTDYKVVEIMYPKGWGKTSNLDMMKMFLQLETFINGTVIPRHDTVGYRLFMKGELYFDGTFDSKVNKPFAISKDTEFCEKYLARYPVIFLNLGTVFGLTLDGVYSTIKDLISEAFGNHDYMLRVFDRFIANKNTIVDDKEDAETKKELFHKYLFASEDKNEMIESLRFLSNVLYDHYKKPTYVFIDDYDAPLWHILQTYPFKEAERDSFIEVYKKFIVTTCEASPHIAKVFVTGSLKLAKEYYFPPWKNIGDFHFMKNELNEYYGFRKHEVDTLFAHGQVPAELRKKAHEYYNGYGPSMNDSERSYNCFAIISFLHNGFQVKPYNIFPPNKPNYMQRFFEIDAFREAVVKLLAGVNVEIDKAALGNLTLSREEYDYLKLFFLDDLSDHGPVVNAAFKIIFSYGFLSLQESPTKGASYLVRSRRASSSDDERVYIKIANKEMWTEIDHQYYTYSTGQKLVKELEEEAAQEKADGISLDKQDSANDYLEKSESDSRLIQ